MNRILPQLLTFLTGARRKQVVAGVDFQWSNNSWVHNIFRAYEVLFGAPFGIRPSIASSNDGTQIAYTFEAQCALFETWVRSLRFRFARLPSFKIVVIPQLQLAGMRQDGVLPYRFAVAFDTAVLGSNGGGTTSASWSHTCTGSNLLLIAASNGNVSATQDITAYTYNSVSLTIAGTGVRTGGTGPFLTMWGLINPATGANTVAVTFPSGQGFGSQASFSYTGVKQSGFPDSYHTTTTAGSGTTDSGSTTTVADNSWLVGFFSDTLGRTDTASTNTTQRITRNGEGFFIGDSNAAQTPPGSYSLNININATVTGRTNIVLSIAPVAGTTYTPTYTEAITNTATLLKSTTRPLTESVTVTATLLKSILRLLTDSITNTDTFTGARVKPVGLSDLISVTDISVRSLIRVLTESITNTGTFIFQSARTFTEAITNTDTFSKIFAHGAVLTESITNTLSSNFKKNGSNVIWTHITRSATAAWSHLTKSNQ